MAKTEKIIPIPGCENAVIYQCECGRPIEYHSPEPIRKLLRCSECRDKRKETVLAVKCED